MSAQVVPMFGAVQLLDEHQLPQSAQQWAIKGLIPEKGFGVIYGPSKSTKTFLTIDLLSHLRNGQAWFGMKVPVPRHVVYVPFEGKGGIPKRIQAWRQAHANHPTGIRFVFEQLNLRQPADQERLVNGILGAGMQNCVLCIDTLAQAGPGIDENSSEGMGEMIAIFQRLQARLDGIVIAIHHTGKDVDRGMRGWSGLLGALDFSIECQFSDGKGADKYDRRFRIDKQKDDEDGKVFDFRVEPVVLGIDGEGDPITSLVVRQRLREPVVVLPPAQNDERHDKLVWHWINEEVTAGNHPSGRSLDAQREAKQPEMGQKELRNAIARLQSKGLLKTEGTGNQRWLRAVEHSPGSGPG